jgi:pimeloyl-ACP methyl ester carboxylesterase
MPNAVAEGRLHVYWPDRNLTLFEYVSGQALDISRSMKSNILVFIGGLYDSFLSVPFVGPLAASINQLPDWGVVEIQLSSSGLGWGISDLRGDVEEIAMAVKYIRRHIRSSYPQISGSAQDPKVVLMGHSTGSQDVLHYLYHLPSHGRPPVDGAILQAAVSDREGLAVMRAEDENVQYAYEQCLHIIRNTETGIQRDAVSVLPPLLTNLLGWPRGVVSQKRFLSLTSTSSPERPELDDLFSSDLSDQTLSKTFGAVGTAGCLKAGQSSKPSVLVLQSGNDEYMPKTVNKEALIDRWKEALEKGDAVLASDSGVVLGASHNIKEPDSQADLAHRVQKYLEHLMDV